MVAKGRWAGWSEKSFCRAEELRVGRWASWEMDDGKRGLKSRGEIGGRDEDVM
jgi:hypothetical protein